MRLNRRGRSICFRNNARALAGSLSGKWGKERDSNPQRPTNRSWKTGVPTESCAHARTRCHSKPCKQVLTARGLMCNAHRGTRVSAPCYGYASDVLALSAPGAQSFRKWRRAVVLPHRPCGPSRLPTGRRASRLYSPENERGGGQRSCSPAVPGRPSRFKRLPAPRPVWPPKKSPRQELHLRETA